MIGQVENYVRGIREQLDEALREPSALQAADPEYGEALLHVAIEHRLMHAETLAYLLHNLAVDRKAAHAAPAHDLTPAPQPSQVTIPEGVATLGQSRDDGNFGWDNEFEPEQHRVPSFSIDVFPVTNAEYLKFVQDGGYENSKYWSAEDWSWKRQHNLDHPNFWVAQSAGLTASDPDQKWDYQGMFGTVPLPPSWPVFVSHAEASAYAKWAGKKLPTEAQWHRAAYGTPRGVEREYPWGTTEGQTTPAIGYGNFHHQRWEPTPVDAHPKGASAFGVQDLLGNGWEWTSTRFGALNGFEPFPFYKGYSADFFDGKHFVIKGGSMRTDACMLRRAFRNWFQPHYPYIYTTFRCVEE
jgi:ergothioneine biosynthesis protein EgtB